MAMIPKPIAARSSTSLFGDVFVDEDDEEEEPQYALGTHDFIPKFDFEDELKGSEYTSQMEALYWMLHGDNMVLCGQAGSGKSWVVNKYREILDAAAPRLKTDRRKLTMAMTASTGAAASLIFGRTIHSWAGLGISVDRFDESTMTDKQRHTWKAAERRIRDTDVLVIDEVSMLPAYFLSNLDKACRLARSRPDQPFGGMQVILVGDFLQLPPVDKHELDSEGNQVDCRYCFHARNEDGRKIITPTHFRFCYLDRSRRSGDNRLNDLLNGMRNGEPVDKLKAMIAPRFDVVPDEGKTYTRLRTINRSVDDYNDKRLASLPGQVHRYPVKREGDKAACRELIANGKLKTTELKVGAVVMVSSNQAHPGYVNGSMGTIVSLHEDMNADGKPFPVIKVRMNRLPDDVKVADEAGISKDLADDMKTIDINYISADKSHIEMQSVYDEDNDSYQIKAVEVVDARVWYIPLRLAWAITIHKSQGQTLDGVVIDMSRCFQKGLGYVAMSRCRSLDDIVMDGEILDLPDDVFRVDHEAQNADKSVRLHAKQSRQEFLDMERKATDAQAMMDAAGSKTEKARIAKRIGSDIRYEDLFRDDESGYEYLRDCRARIDRSRR